MLFEVAAQGYLDFRSRRVSARTLQIDRERLVPLLRAFAGRDLDALTGADVAAYQRWRTIAGVSARTINMEAGVLRRMLKRGGLWAVLSDRIESLPETPRRARVLSEPEKAHLFAVARSNPRWLRACCAAVIASNTTCRKVELRHVRRRDVDLATAVLLVTVTKGRTAGLREIPINAAAGAAFRELLAWGEKLGFTRPEDWIFPGRDAKSHRWVRSRPVNSWRSAWRSLTRAAGLAGLRFHDLRHQAVTELRENGTPDAVVMALSGHKSTAMLDHYTHARLNAMRAAVERLVVAEAVPEPPSKAEPDLSTVLEMLAALLKQKSETLHERETRSNAARDRLGNADLVGADPANAARGTGRPRGE